MTSLTDYQNKYSTIAFEREDGILLVRFHTDGGPMQWSAFVHDEWANAFSDIGNDRENRVIIMTGTGDSFSGPVASPQSSPKRRPASWDEIRFNGIRLVNNLLNIEAPIISAVNGPAVRHADAPLLADIVLASETAAFQDSGHMNAYTVPGDGMHVTMPLLMGVTRARYFLFTGQRIEAEEAKEIGLVNEVLPPADLLPRAWELARELIEKPPLVLRYARILLTQQIRLSMHQLLGYGVALEGLASGERWAELNVDAKQ